MEKETKSPTPGLNKLRNNPSSPLTPCSNCKCSRYGACGCTKKGAKKA